MHDEENMEIRLQRVAYTLVLVTGLAVLVGCDAGGSTTPSFTPGASTNTPTPAPTASATVSWTAPLARVDGTSASINEIGGYNIYYGTSPTALTKVVRVPDAYIFTYNIGNLALSTYYFVVTAYDSKGVESAYSNVVTRVIK
jgi:hypothetical protein